MKLSDQLLSLVGKKDTDPDFQAFLLKWKGKYEARLSPFSDSQTWLGYYFNEYGFCLRIEPNWDYIFDIIFFVSGTRPGPKPTNGIEPYGAPLPFGLAYKDNRDGVRRKLGSPHNSRKSQGTESEFNTDSFKIDSFRVRAMFKNPEHGIIALFVIFDGRVHELFGKPAVCATRDIEPGTTVSPDSVQIRNVAPRRISAGDTIVDTASAIGKIANRKIKKYETISETDLA